MTQFDILIPVGPNDKDIISKQIEYTKKNIVGYRNIYLVMPEPLIQIKDCITISENIYPFSKKWIEEINPVIKKSGQGGGWYLQQLIKLLSFHYIDDILDNYLVIDTDTFFIKKTIFFERDIPLYNTGGLFQYCPNYYSYMKKLGPEFVRTTRINRPAICHHMIFQKKYVNEIIQILENKYKDKKIYEILIDNVTCGFSGFSEYELYFHFMNKFHKEKIKIRRLKFLNNGKYKFLEKKSRYSYISLHYYLRK